MRRPGSLLLGVACLGFVVACGATVTPGEMSSQTYRSLEADDQLTLTEAEESGAIASDELATTHLDEGGTPARAELECLYARVLYGRTAEAHQYRGTARFCFDVSGAVVSVDRHRPDVPDAP